MFWFYLEIIEDMKGDKKPFKYILCFGSTPQKHVTSSSRKANLNTSYVLVLQMKQGALEHTERYLNTSYVLVLQQ